MICLRCHHRKFEYGNHPNYGNCCLCAQCRRYVVVIGVSPDELATMYMGLITAEVKITGIQPSLELIDKYWPFPAKTLGYTLMWRLWKEKAIERFGIIAVRKAGIQKPAAPGAQQLGMFEVQP